MWYFNDDYYESYCCREDNIEICSKQDHEEDEPEW